MRGLAKQQVAKDLEEAEEEEEPGVITGEAKDLNESEEEHE